MNTRHDTIQLPYPPRAGYLDRIKRIISYLSRFRSGAIRICTDKPDLSKFKTLEYDWSNSPYAGAREEVLYNVPVPKGELVKRCGRMQMLQDALSGKADVLQYFTSSTRHRPIGKNKELSEKRHRGSSQWNSAVVLPLASCASREMWLDVKKISPPPLFISPINSSLLFLSTIINSPLTLNNSSLMYKSYPHVKSKK